MEDDDIKELEEKKGIHSRNLYQPPSVKTCFFYKDGDKNVSAVKLTLDPKIHKNMGVLQDQLTKRIQLPFGVRSIYTPRGRERVLAWEDLENDGRYVCSTSRNKAKGIDIASVAKLRAWKASRVPSGKKQYNETLKTDSNHPFQPNVQRRRPPPRNAVSDSEMDSYRPPGNNKFSKKIVIVRNGDPNLRRSMLLSRRAQRSFEIVLQDISGMFGKAVHALWTPQGEKVESLSSIFNGGDTYVVALNPSERFKPSTRPLSDDQRRLPPTRKPPKRQRSRQEHDPVASKLKDRRERLAKTRGIWKVWVTTNELPTAGTQAQVTITVYGHKGNSGLLTLGHPDGQNFQAGQIEEFDEDRKVLCRDEINCGNIGEIYKIRISHDNSGSFPGWFCDEVRMVDSHTNEELTFLCRRWLSRDEDDREICRELPVVRKDEAVLPVHRYQVTVYTGDIWNAGTDANVYLTVYGERGDTGVRQLIKKDDLKKFQKGHIDIFNLEAVSLGKLKRLIIGHDANVLGEGWYLDKVVIKESQKSQEEWTFPCFSWLDEGEGDKKIVRELKVLEEYKTDIVEKSLWDLEKWKWIAENQVILFSKLTLQALRINHDASVDVLGQDKEATTIFKVIVRRGPNFVLQSAENPRFHVAIDNCRILGNGKGGGYCEFRLRVQQDRSVMFESAKHVLQHITAAQNGSMADPRGTVTGPPQQFQVYCKGMFRDQGVLLLCTSIIQTLSVDHKSLLYATGIRNRTAEFKVHKVKEGGVRKFESIGSKGKFLRIREGQCDCLGAGDKWCHFKVVKYKEKGYVALESIAQRGLFIGMTPDGQVRPTVDTGDKNTRLWPHVTKWGIPKNKPKPPSPEPVKKTEKTRKRDSPTPEPKSTPVTPTPRHKSKPVSAESIYQDGDWKVWITTSETAQRCQIFMVVYGTKNKSESILLGESNDGEIFQADSQDQFKINLKSIGSIYKIRLELNSLSSKDPPEWKIKDLKMQDMNSKETLKFKFNRWLSRRHDDQDIFREQPAVRPGKAVLPILLYQVRVYTGKDPGSDTDANIYICLHGERGDTGKRLLINSNNSTKFQEGQLDIFNLEAVSLGELKMCLVGHDGEGPGEGWFCEQIIIRESEDAKHEYVFTCNKWFDKSMDDKKIERALKLKEKRPIPKEVEEKKEEPEPEPEPEKQEEPPKPGEWIVWITTGSKAEHSTKNSVNLWVYGDKGKNGPVALKEPVEDDRVPFEAGATDEFKINLGTDFGELYKIRIGHEEEDRKSGWFIEKIKMKDLVSNELLTFKVNRWLSRQEEDLDVWRELPAVRPGKKALPILTYKLEIHTSSEPGSDTEAELYIELHGSRGDSGRRTLYQSKNSDIKFQQGQMDIFELEAVSLDDIQKIIIGHKEETKGAGWCLEKVIVRVEEGKTEKMFYFPSNQWFDKGQSDSAIEREILAQEPPPESTGEFIAYIKTAESSGQPNGSNARLVIYTEEAGKKEYELKKDESFKPGNKDEFEFTLKKDCGGIWKIRLEREDEDLWEGGWFVEEVVIQDKETKEEQKFVYNKWLAHDKESCETVREQTTDNNKDPLKNYEVQVCIGDHWSAGTLSDLYLTIFGKRGDSGKRWLRKQEEIDYDRKSENLFNLEAVCLQELESITIGHNGIGYGSGLFLEKIVIKETSNRYVFYSNRWFDDHEDDRLTERELKLFCLDDDSLALKPCKENTKTQGEWNVKIKTSDIHNAGTHAKVAMVVYGSKSISKEIKLDKNNDEQFDRNKESDFDVKVGDIGDIKKIRIYHDNSGSFPAWHCHSILMTDKHTNQTLLFPFQRWFAEDEDDNETIREMSPFTSENLITPVLRYWLGIRTANVKKAGTEGDVKVKITGKDGDSGWRILQKSLTNDKCWQQAAFDVFLVEAVSLGSITGISIDHQPTETNGAWLIEEIIIKESEFAPTEWTFSNKDWLEPSKDGSCIKELLDPRIQPASELPEYSEDRQVFKSKGNWTLKTYTDTETEPIKLKAFVTVCGTLSSSDDVQLLEEVEDGETKEKKDESPEEEQEEKTQEFNPGQFNVFKLSVGDKLGDLIKLRFTAYFGEEKATWKLRKFILKDDDTNTELFSICDKVLEVNEENKECIVEIGLSRPDIPPLMEKTYTVEVKTGEQLRADTESDITLDLHGVFGDTGVRLLNYLLVDDQNNKQPEEKKDDREENNEKLPSLLFDLGKINKFEIQALDIGTLNEITLGHNSIGRGRGWFFDYISIKDSKDTNSSLLFLGDRWLDTGCNDRLLQSTLKPFMDLQRDEREKDERTIDSKGRWLVTVKTTVIESTEYNLVVYDSLGRSQIFQVDNSNEKEIELTEIGIDIYKIRMESLLEDSSWNVLKVQMKDKDTKEKLEFDFSRSLNENLLSAERPLIRIDQPIPQLISYIVSIHTAEEEALEAEENSDKASEESITPSVSILLKGKYGDSGIRKLKENENEKMFQSNQHDEFILEAVNLGSLSELVIYRTDGVKWHFDSVQIIAGKFDHHKAIFDCDEILPRDEDTESVTLSLTKYTRNAVAIPVEEIDDLPKTEGSWKVTTWTGEEENSSPLLPVHLVICGYTNSTDLIPLKLEEEDKKPFELGAEDSFDINLSSDTSFYGDFFKIRLAFDQETEKIDTSWFLKKIKLEDTITKDFFICEYDDVIKLDSEKDGVVELPIIWPAIPPLPNLNYEIKVTTGNRFNASIEGPIYIEIFGENGDSGKRWLKKSDQETMFAQGQIDTFIIQGVHLADLSKVIIGHEHEETGKGWYLEKVEIKEQLEEGKTFLFECDRWLDTGEDDNAIERELMLTGDPIEKPPGELWKISTVSGEELIENKSQFLIAIYGSDSKTEDLLLWESEEFKSGESQDFELFSEEAVGEPYKVRIGFSEENKDDKPSWLFKEFKMQNIKTGVEYKFKCDERAFAITDETDGWIEYPVLVEDEKTDNPNPEGEEKPNEDEKNDKPNEEQQKKSNEEKTKENDKDEKSEEKPPVGDEESKTDEDRKDAETDENNKEKEQLEVYKYTISTFTGDKDESGTKANVYLEVYGNRGDTGKRRLLSSSESALDNFKSGQKNTFIIEAVDLLDLTHVLIGHDGKEAGNGWFLNKVVIEVETKKDGQKKFSFPCNRWLDEGEDDGLIERKLEVKPAGEPWHFDVKTCSEEESEIEGEAILMLYGDKGKSKQISLKSPSGKFDIKSVEKFDTLVEYVGDEIGELYKVIIGLAEKEDPTDSALWKLNRIVAKKLEELPESSDDKEGESPKENANEDNEGENKDDNETDEKKTDEKESEEGKKDEDKKEDDSNKETDEKKKDDEENKDKGDNEEDKKDNSEDAEKEEKKEDDDDDNDVADDELLFKANKWIKSTPETDSWLEIPLFKKNPEEMLKILTYTIEIYTSDLENADTDALAFIELQGERGDSHRRKLKKGKRKTEGALFRRGRRDVFDIDCVDLSELKTVLLGHDNGGSANGWHVNKVIVRQRLETKKKFIFNCDKWFDENQEDNLIERVLELTEAVDDDGPNEDDWKLTLVTSDKEKADTDAQVTLTVFGEIGNSGPLPIGEPGQGLFQKGAKDEVDILVDYNEVGKLTKVRLEHDNSKGNEDSSWHVEKVIMENLLSGDELEFKVDKWLSATEEEGNIMIELSAEWPEKDPLEAKKYEITIKYGKDSKVGDGQLDITLFDSESNDTGKRLIFKKKDGEKPAFKEDTEEEFVIETVGLKDIQAVTLGLQGEDEKVFIESVSVKDPDEKVESFECNEMIESKGEREEKKLEKKEEDDDNKDDDNKDEDNKDKDGDEGDNKDK